MPTRARRLSREGLVGWLEGLLRGGVRVIAPVDEDGLRLFQPVESIERVTLQPGKTRWSPKEFLFPRTEPLFSYSIDGNEVRLDGPVVEPTEQVLFGVRPCDVAGFLRLDAVFLKGEADPLYADRRAATTVVSLACDDVQPECFCTAVGGSPAGEEGSDLQLVSLGDGWLMRPLTPKGERLAAAAGDGARPASPEELARARERARQVEERIRTSPVAREWAALLEGSFHLPLWDAVGQRCLGCSICTYVCPSCSCFDVGDTGNAVCGERCRSWDSCTFALFTRHASGHNPRPTPASRYRQRVLHKFAYYPLLNGGEFMCVGCGRCVALCPVGMNIRESVHAVVAASREGTDAER